MKRSSLKLLIPLLLICLLTAFVIIKYNLSILLMIIATLTLIATIVFTVIFLIKCLKWYTTYMFLNKSTFNYRIDRPRIYIFTLFIPLMGIITYTLNNYTGMNIFSNDWSSINQCIDIIFCSIFICLFFVLCNLLIFTLGQKFDKIYLPALIKVVEKVSEPYVTYLEPDRLNDIFDGLVEHNFLLYDDLKLQNEHKEQFIKLIISRKFPNNPFLKLNMDNLQTYVLYEELRKEMKGFKLNHLLQFFSNRNLKTSSETIKEGYRKCTPNNIKERNKIELIFRKK